MRRTGVPSWLWVLLGGAMVLMCLCMATGFVIALLADLSTPAKAPGVPGSRLTPSVHPVASPTRVIQPTETRAVQATGAVSEDESDFWNALPMPPDATMAPVTEGTNMGYRTNWPPERVLGMYAQWLKARGWRIVPKEDMPNVAFPQGRAVGVWRKGYAFFAVVAWLQDGATQVDLIYRTAP